MTPAPSRDSPQGQPRTWASSSLKAVGQGGRPGAAELSRGLFPRFPPAQDCPTVLMRQFRWAGSSSARDGRAQSCTHLSLRLSEPLRESAGPAGRGPFLTQAFGALPAWPSPFGVPEPELASALSSTFTTHQASQLSRVNTSSRKPTPLPTVGSVGPRHSPPRSPRPLALVSGVWSKSQSLSAFTCESGIDVLSGQVSKPTSDVVRAALGEAGPCLRPSRLPRAIYFLTLPSAVCPSDPAAPVTVTQGSSTRCSASTGLAMGRALGSGLGLALVPTLCIWRGHAAVLQQEGACCGQEGSAALAEAGVTGGGRPGPAEAGEALGLRVEGGRSLQRVTSKNEAFTASPRVGSTFDGSLLSPKGTSLTAGDICASGSVFDAQAGSVSPLLSGTQGDAAGSVLGQGPARDEHAEDASPCPDRASWAPAEPRRGVLRCGAKPGHVTWRLRPSGSEAWARHLASEAVWAQLTASPRGRVALRPATAPPSSLSRLARETRQDSEPTATPLLARAGLRGPRARARGCPRVGSVPIGPRRPCDPEGRASRSRSGAAPARAVPSCTRTRPRALRPWSRRPDRQVSLLVPARAGARAVRERGAGARAGGRAASWGAGTPRPAASAARVRARRLPRAALSPGWGGGQALDAARRFPRVAGGGRPGWEA
ncbi:unnamed protein product [Rangifer tarandus platyrhynchus]|uniref:Uncharacterized protein n=1 Tax=Rangifer tarandus platyrhynchus TaxID=3082113 RepID=A0ABN8Y0A9_RANTA|nr:unnamed protein product [Rangifer tarandus platyrhynchus]